MKFDPTSLKFDDKGLVPAIAQDHENGDVLMMAWMNAESIQRTLDTGRVTYWSRSRQEFWEKGLTSGHTQKLISLHIDCDRDCILMKVEQIGAACHTNRRHCFFVEVTDGTERETLKPIS